MQHVAVIHRKWSEAKGICEIFFETTGVSSCLWHLGQTFSQNRSLLSLYDDNIFPVSIFLEHDDFGNNLSFCKSSLVWQVYGHCGKITAEAPSSHLSHQDFLENQF
jgi:hypothetical protein